MPVYSRAKRAGQYRSGFEGKLAYQLTQEGARFGYESLKIKFQEPATNHTYTPDFILENGIIVEAKGRFLAADRKKHILVKAQHPELDIRFVFCNPNAKLYKGATSTYGDWCDEHGFQYARGAIPRAWLLEPAKPYLNTIREGVIPYVAERSHPSVSAIRKAPHPSKGTG